MSDHPSTFSAGPYDEGRIDWDDRAEIHQNDDGQGLFDGAKALHKGTLAQMVALIGAMPEGERDRFVIQKLGDHKLEPAEIASLAARPDFPGRR